MFGHFIVNIIKRIAQRLRRIILLHFGTSNLYLGFVFGKPENHHFHDFRNSGRAHDSPNQYYFIGDTKTHQTIRQTVPNHFENILVV